MSDMVNSINTSEETVEKNKTSSNNDEESFVILGSSPSESMNITAPNSINTSINHQFSYDYNWKQCDPQRSGMMVSCSASNPLQSLPVETISIRTMSIDEIQKQFNILLDENRQLKENLLQSNNDLRREFNKIMNYQEEVRKIHEGHRKKFEETRQLVNKLKTENALLKENLRHVTEQEDSKSEITYLQNEVEKLTSDLKVTQEKYNEIKGQYELSVPVATAKEKEIDKLILKQTQLEEQINLLASEKLNLEKELERTNYEKNICTERIDEMKSTIDPLKTRVANLTSHQYKLETEIVDLNAEIKLYKEELNKAQLKLSEKCGYEMVSDSADKSFALINTPSLLSDVISNLQEEIQKLQTELKEALVNKISLTMDPLSLSVNQDFSYSESSASDIEKKIQLYHKYLQDAISWYNDHCKRMNLLRYILKDLQPDNITSIEKMKSKLLELQKFSNDFCDSLSKEWIFFKTSQSNFQTIYNEYKTLLKEMDSINTTNKVKDDVHQKEIEKLSNQLQEKDETIKAINEEMNAKQKELDQLNINMTQIEVLTQQMEIYREDFEEERKARTAFAGENEQLKADMRRVQLRNEDLLKRLSSQGTEVPPEPSDPGSSSEKKTYPCPLCQFSFHTLQAVQNHVERCLEIKGSI